MSVYSAPRLDSVIGYRFHVIKLFELSQTAGRRIDTSDTNKRPIFICLRKKINAKLSDQIQQVQHQMTELTDFLKSPKCASKLQLVYSWEKMDEQR